MPIRMHHFKSNHTTSYDHIPHHITTYHIISPSQYMAPELLCRNTMPSAFAFLLQEGHTDDDIPNNDQTDPENPDDENDLIQHKVCGCRCIV